MCEKVLCFAILFGVINSISAVSVPFITKCDRSDSKCIMYNAVNAIPIFAAGIPEMGVEQLDPLYISKIDASTPNFKLIINDGTLEGLKDCQVLKIKHDRSHTKAYISLDCTIDFHGKYDLDGQFLIFQLQGNGNVHLKLRNYQVNVEVNFNEKLGKDGKLHYNIKGLKYTFSIKGKTDIELEDASPGNELLSRAAQELLSGDNNAIAEEIGAPLIRYVVDKIEKNLKNFFQAVAIEDIEIV